MYNGQPVLTLKEPLESSMDIDYTWIMVLVRTSHLSSMVKDYHKSEALMLLVLLQDFHINSLFKQSTSQDKVLIVQLLLFTRAQNQNLWAPQY